MSTYFSWRVAVSQAVDARETSEDPLFHRESKFRLVEAIYTTGNMSRYKLSENNCTTKYE